MATKWHGDLRNRIQQGDFLQEEVARLARYDPAYFSRVLRGRTVTPDDFEAKVTAALHRMEAAEVEAEKARARVLAETEA